MLYHCASRAQPLQFNNISSHFLFSNSSGEIWTLNLWIMSQVFYYWANGAQLLQFNEISCHFLSPSSSCWFWAIGLWIMSQVFCHCANRAQPLQFNDIFCLFLFPSSSRGIWTLDLWIWVQCSTTELVGHNDHFHSKTFLAISSLSVPAVGSEPSIFRIWVKYFTIVLIGPDHSNLMTILTIFSLTVHWQRERENIERHFQYN